MADEKFSIKIITGDIARKEIMNLYGSKVTSNGDTSFYILKSTADIHLPYITNMINVSIENVCFPVELMLAEVSPIFRKKDDLNEENYWPASVLSHVSKVFERIMHHQINDFMTDKLSK